MAVVQRVRQQHSVEEDFVSNTEYSFFLYGVTQLPKKPCLRTIKQQSGCFGKPAFASPTRGQGSSAPLWGVGWNPANTF